MAPREIKYKTRYRGIKYPRLEFKTGSLELILPYNYKPEVLVSKHRQWIDRKTRFIKACLKDSKNKKIIKRSMDEFRSLAKLLAMDSAGELGVKINGVFFRPMKTKWASFSKKRNLTLNTLMKFLPERLIKYIIYHEVTHLLERHHNEKFWKAISKKYPDYPRYEKSLFSYWFRLHNSKMEKLTE